MVVFSILDLEGWLEGRVIIDGCWKRLLFLNTLSPVLKDKLLDSLYSLERRYFQISHNFSVFPRSSPLHAFTHLHSIVRVVGFIGQRGFRNILLSCLNGVARTKSLQELISHNQYSRTQIVIMNNLTRVLYGMARNLRRAPRSGIRAQQADPQSVDVTSVKQENTSLEKEIEDQIEPFSYDIQVQQSLKAKVIEELKYSYEGEDPNPHKLVHRPSKGAAWGLGGQLMLASKKVQLQGLRPQTDEIVQFLQLHQVKNIYVHDFFAENSEQPDSNRRRYHILGSCFSAKHCWKTGLQLKNAFNLNSAKTKLRRKKEYDPIYALLNGGKDEEWVMVQYKDYDISMMTEQQRQAMDLEWKWNNPVAEETIDKHIQMKLRKGRKKMFQDL